MEGFGRFWRVLEGYRVGVLEDSRVRASKFKIWVVSRDSCWFEMWIDSESPLTDPLGSSLLNAFECGIESKFYTIRSFLQDIQTEGSA